MGKLKKIIDDVYMYHLFLTGLTELKSILRILLPPAVDVVFLQSNASGSIADLWNLWKLCRLSRSPSVAERYASAISQHIAGVKYFDFYNKGAGALI